jgi:sulfate adenylyltransferase small subunit
VRTVEDSIAAGRVVLRRPDESRNPHQSVTLLDAIAEFGFDACIGGARRDEEKSRAKERIVSFRDAFGQWDPKQQRPELWNLYNARVGPGEHVRVFPISNWTELDVWRYIAREKLEVPSLYLAHAREVVRRAGALVPVTALTPARDGETVESVSVRFRTVGDITCTAPVASTAATLEAIVAETAAATVTERGATRLDDRTNDVVDGAAQAARLLLMDVLRFLTAGSVDDGKSTLIGRLLHDTRAILADQLDALVRSSNKRGTTLDLSLLTDGLAPSASKASRSTSRSATSRRPRASSSSPTRPVTRSTRATW